MDAPRFPEQRICFSCRGYTVTGGMRETVIDSFNKEARDDYMKKHFGTDSSTGVNWIHIARVLKTERKSHGKYSKMLYEQLSTFTACALCTFIA